MKITKEANDVINHASIFKSMDGELYNEEYLPCKDAENAYVKVYPVESEDFEIFARKVAYEFSDTLFSENELKNIKGCIKAVSYFSLQNSQQERRVYNRRASVWKDGQFSFVFNNVDEYIVIENDLLEVRRLKPPLDTTIVKGALKISSIETQAKIEDVLAIRNLINPKIDNEDLLFLITFCTFNLMGLDSPQVVLQLLGPQGCGKTFLSKLLAKIIDPTSTPLRSPPKNEEDLMISFSKTTTPIFDNISRINGVLSDALCRATTGGSFSKRKLYTDSEESSITVKGSLVLNSIVDNLWRPDLRDRGHTITLEPISKEDKKSEIEVKNLTSQVYPQIMGGFFNLIKVVGSEFLKESVNTELRFQEFVRVGEIANSQLNLVEKTFSEVLENKRNSQGLESAFQDVLFLLLLVATKENGKLLSDGYELKGYVYNIFQILLGTNLPNAFDEVSKKTIGSHPAGFGGLLARKIPEYSKYGLSIEKNRKSKAQHLTIKASNELLEVIEAIENKRGNQIVSKSPKNYDEYDI